MALRERKPDVAIALADVPGAALYSYYTTGELKAEGSSITEGIGQGRITANLEGFDPDQSYFIPDEESVASPSRCSSDEGLALGLSSGVNVAGAIRLARELGPGQDHRHHAVRSRRPATSRGCSTPNSCARRASRRPDWLEQPQHIEPDFVPCRSIAAPSQLRRGRQ